jgi:acetylornithine/N-succinyldiaminopimelate aminotransferase
VNLMRDKGVIINRTHETTLRFLPPYNVSKKNVDEVIVKLDAVLGVIEKMPPSSTAPKEKIGN